MVVMDVNIVEKSKNKETQTDTMFEMEVDESDAELTKALDYCMLEMLNWLQDDRDVALNTMCTVFERIILPTHGIR